MRRAVLAVLGLVLLLIGSMAGGVAWWLGRAGSGPELLIQHADGNLVLADAHGQIQPLTVDADGKSRIYAHPVPSPDGRSVAYVQTLHGTTAVSSSLVVHRISGERRSLFDSRESLPFYLNWSPDSSQIAFLTGGQEGMVLRTVNTLGQPVAQRVVPGDPSYFSWKPDGQRLLLHTGGSAPEGSLALWSIGDPEPRKLDAEPGLFQAPAWVEDGRAAIAVIKDGADAALARIGEDGRVEQRLATAPSGMLFVMAPSGKEVAYIPVTRTSPGHIHIVGVDGAGQREVTSSPALSFLWSPDGTRIAYLTASQGDETSAVALQDEEELRLVWNVLDVATGKSRALKSFLPSLEFLNLLPYFDQYAQSIQLWDRAGRRLVYADEDGVWILDVTTGESTKADDGVLGMWIKR